MIVSFSDVLALKHCAGQAVMRAKTQRYEKAGPARVGVAGHGLLLQYARHCQTLNWQTDITRARELVKEIGPLLSPADQANFEEMALKCVESLTFEFLEGATEVHLEERIFIHVPSGKQLTAAESLTTPGLIYAFTPDMWWIDANGILHVLDWKTGWVIEHVSGPDLNFQLRAYCGGILFLTNIGAAYGHIYHTRHSYMETSGSRPEEMPVPWDANELLEWFQTNVIPLAVLLSEHILHGSGPYTTGSHCPDCDFRGRCPAYNAMPAEYDTVQNDTLKLFNMYVALDSKASVLKSRLRKLVNENGPVTSGNRRVSLKDVDKGKIRSTIRKELETLLPTESVQACYVPSTKGIRAVFKANAMKEFGAALIEKHKDVRLETHMRVVRVEQGREAQEEEADE